MSAGDLDPGNLEKGSNHTVCVENVGDFTEAFLFSLETQHTIGWVPVITNYICMILSHRHDSYQASS